MPEIVASKLRNGTTFEYRDDPWRVLDYKHTHLSRGAGTIRVKSKNLKTGDVRTLTFKSGEKVEDVYVVKRPMQYLYRDDAGFVFMNPTTFEQLTISAEVLGDSGLFLKEGENASVLFWEDDPIDVDIPPKVVMEVVEAAPGEKGDSASNVYKDAKLENGMKVRVPLFVGPGEKIRVDTRSGEYIERA